MEEGKNPWDKRLKRALGAFLFFCVALILLSPIGSFWPLGYGAIWLFGYVGYYALLPLLGLYGLFVLLFGKRPKIGLFAYLAIVFMALGALLLFGIASYESSDSSLQNVVDIYSSATAESCFLTDIRYSGGFAFSMIAGVLDSWSRAIAITIAAVFFVIALLFIIFHPALRALYAKAIANKKKRKASDPSAEKPASATPVATSAAPRSGFDAYFPSPEEPKDETPEATEETAEEPSPEVPSRLRASRDERIESAGLPKEIDSPLNAVIPTASERAFSGYSEARFSFPSETPQAPRPAQFVQPAVPTSAPSSNPLFSNDVSLAKAEEPAPSPIEDHTVPETPGVPERKGLFEFLAEEETPSPSVSHESMEPTLSTVISDPSLEETAISPSITEEIAPQNEEIPAETPAETIPVTPATPVTPEPIPEQPTLTPSIPSAPPMGKKPTLEELLDSVSCKRKKERPPYTFPPIDLLKEYPPSPEAMQEKMNCERRKELIDRCFQDFGIGAHVESYTIGPSVTRYNIMTDSNVSVSSLNRIVKDIAVRLEGAAVRFEEVVRGRTTSGLEVPNKKTTTVSLKRMISSLPPNSGPDLMIPFGVSIDDECISSDLSEFPHMLVAGTTGSGKSIFMNGMIMSLIMRNRPEDVKLVMVDPKRVEMAKYHDLPHLLCPIIKEPSEAKVCIDKLIAEMERRYKAFEYANVRDIGEWNRDFAPSSPYAPLPYIVLFIDEYADLADTCKNIGESVVRIAQKARAAGIHMVIATQRPTVQVISGTIKANIATHVALTMKSAVDSATILGVGGAENLVGHGDMLVDCTQVSRGGFTRCQGCFCSGGEINAVCDYIRGQLPADYDPYFLDLVDHEAERKAQEESIVPLSKADIRAQSGADFYQSVKEWVMTQETTSISKIMRHFGTGFPRAGKLLAQLQSEGIVAESDTASNAKGCRVLIHSESTLSSGSVSLQGDNE